MGGSQVLVRGFFFLLWYWSFLFLYKILIFPAIYHQLSQRNILVRKRYGRRQSAWEKEKDEQEIDEDNAASHRIGALQNLLMVHDTFFLFGAGARLKISDRL